MRFLAQELHPYKKMGAPGLAFETWDPPGKGSSPIPRRAHNSIPESKDTHRAQTCVVRFDWSSDLS